MTEEIRIFLYYPLGLLPSLAFTLRFIVQWLSSEIHKKSIVPASFWWLSLVGNVTLMAHSAIQLQYPICLIQAVNSVISLRNLNLMQSKEKRWRLSSVLALLGLAFAAPSLGFFLFSSDQWFRIPAHFFSPNQNVQISFYWQLAGFLGVFLFAFRFWLQWVEAEINKKSSLEAPFWWLSLIGALFSLCFFYRIGDIANLLGPLFGIVPYLRNLMLLSENKKEAYDKS